MKSRLFLVFAVFAFCASGVFSDEITPAQRRELDRREDARLWALQINAALRYQADGTVNSACGNGDFETGLDPAEWSGGHGSVKANGDPDFANFTGGLFPGPLTDANAHQTLVTSGTDPIVGISLVAPVGVPPATASTRAVRIGNAINGAGSELLSKTFVVTNATSLIPFWYAVVLEDPEHDPLEQPSFWVRVLDSSGALILGAADLGNGSDKAVADRSNPFFQTTAGGDVVYRDWTCAVINLSGYIGQTVTVQFVTEDCTLTGHYGYAYVDNFCGLCEGPEGTLKYAPAASTNCGKGKLCFDYTLPSSGATTGTVQVELDIIQSGTLIATFTSPVLTGGTQYCFDIDPAAIPGLSSSAGSFDWIATGQFAIGATVLAPRSVSSIADPGIGPYKRVCEVGCCPGTNLITNGDFESGNSGFTSAYTNVAIPPIGPVLPGQYAVVNSAQAVAVASSWNAQNPSSCSTTGKYLAVNGATGLSSGGKVAWSQSVPVIPGREYRFCANFRNLAQCALDVKPKVEIRFSSPASSSSSVISANAANGCDWVRESRTFVAASALLTIDILLDESGAGDGNDLAIDDISLQELTPANPAELLVNVASSNVTTTTYNMTATPPAQLHNFTWDVCEVDLAGNCIAGTQVANGWPAPGATNFPGYVGTSSPTGAGAGLFQVQKKYKVVYSVFGECTSRTFSTWYFGFSINSRRVVVEDSMRVLSEALQ